MCLKKSLSNAVSFPAASLMHGGLEITAQKEAELESLFEQGYRALGVMERHLGDREFFVEDHPTTADVALYVYPRICPEGGYDLEGFPAVHSWMERVEALPEYIAPPG